MQIAYHKQTNKQTNKQYDKIECIDTIHQEHSKTCNSWDSKGRTAGVIMGEQRGSKGRIAGVIMGEQRGSKGRIAGVVKEQHRG